MAVQETNGYLDVENATLRSSKVEVTSNLGIANTAPQHAFSVGSNLYIDTESSDVITVKGNVRTEGVKMGFIEITPSYDFAAVSNVGNVTANTIIFNNDNQGFVATGNATIGSTLTISGFRITAAAAAEDDLDAITTSTEDKPNAGKTENPIHLEGATAATSYTTGILQVGNSTNQGGMGVAGNVYVNQGVYTQDLSVENVVSNLAVNTDDLFVDIENSRVGIGKTEPTVALDVVGAVTASGGLTIGSNTAVNTDDLFVDTVNSRVGIGKTEPTVALDVVGAVTASGNMTVTGTSKVGIGTDTLDAVLNVGTGTPASGDQIIKLNTDSPWAFEHETNGLALRSSAANKKLYVQASDFSNVATFDVNGNNVGIGLTDPASKLHVMGDIIGRNVSNTHTITGTDGGSDTFTLLPDQNRILIQHVGSTTADGAYTVNMTGGIPTTIGSILYLEIESSKVNEDGASHTHSTTFQIAAATYLTTGSITVTALNTAGDVYERTLRRTIILTSDGWKDYSVYPKLSVPTTDDAIIFSTTENATQATAGADKPLVERLRITGNGNVGIGTNAPDNALHIRDAIPAVLLDDSDDDTKVRITGGAGGDLYVDSNWGGSGNTGDIIFRKASSEKMRIKHDGNVGIGTASPDTNLHVMGDIIGRSIFKTRTITKGTSLSGEVNNFAFEADENRILLNNNQGSTNSSRDYTANFITNVPTVLGTIIHLEINSARTNNGATGVNHRTTIQFNSVDVLSTGNIYLPSTGNVAYQRNLKRTIILTTEGWVDYSLYPCVSKSVGDDAVIVSATNNARKASVGADNPLTEVMRVQLNGFGNPQVGINCTPVYSKTLDVNGNVQAGNYGSAGGGTFLLTHNTVSTVYTISSGDKGFISAYSDNGYYAIAYFQWISGKTNASVNILVNSGFSAFQTDGSTNVWLKQSSGSAQYGYVSVIRIS